MLRLIGWRGLRTVAIRCNRVGSVFVGRLKISVFAAADGLGFDFFAEQVRHRTDRVDTGQKIRDVEEAGFFKADIDKRSLHPGQHSGHLALVDISYQTALLAALEIKLGQRIVFD
jgi:hypothetical protein